MIYSEYVLISIVIPILLTCIYVKGSARRYAGFFAVGMVTCLISAYIGGYVQHLTGFNDEWMSVYVSPVTEEFFKMIPILIYLILSDPEDDALFSSGVAFAAGFATFENCCYILASGAENLTFVLIRGLAVGILHIVCVIVFCIGLIVVRRIVSLSLPGIIGALSLSMTFHSLYNLLESEPGASSVIGYILPVTAAIVLYYPYRRLAKKARNTMSEI